MASIIDAITKNRKVKFDSTSLEASIMKKLGTSKLTRESLSNLNSLTYSAKNEEISQHDIDILGKYCTFNSLSISDLNLEGKSLESLKVEKFRIDNGNLKDTKLGSLGTTELMVRECENFEISQLENIQSKSLIISYIGYKNDFKPYKTLKDLNKIKDIESLKRVSLVGILNAEDLEISNNVNKLAVNNCDLKDLGVLKKFKSVKYLEARSNLYSDLSPVLDMKNLDELNADDSKLSADNSKILNQIKSEREFFYISCRGTPLGEELKREDSEKVEEKRESEKVIIENPELLKHLKKVLHKEEYNQITETDLKEYANMGNNNFEIPSNLVKEFIDSDFSQKLNISRLTVDINKDEQFDVSDFLSHKKKDNIYGQLTLKLETPELNFSKEDINLLNSRYGITYDIYGENYHIDEVKKIEKGVKELTPELPENMDDLEKISAIYSNIREKIEIVDRKLVQVDFGKTKFGLSTGDTVVGGTMTYFEAEKPSLKKIDTIIEEKKANEYGMTILLNAVLSNANFDVTLKDDTKYTGVLESNSVLVENTVKNEVKINGKVYGIQIGSDGLEYKEKENIVEEKTSQEKEGIAQDTATKEKDTISSSEIKNFTKDISKAEVKGMLGEFINELDTKNIGDKHEEI